ncbi:hypothetical protein H0H92_002015 [Tricholoma furcatifolium]|nr:hypothetical protein H0H92_002015 [Tricholoma furcatifolium]
MQAMFDLSEPRVIGANRWVRGRDLDGAHWSSRLKNIPKILRNEVFDLNGDAIVASCQYRWKEYFNGFRVLTKEFTIISPNVIVSTEELLDAMRFCAEDPVKVVRVRLQVLDGPSLEINTAWLRKHLSIADEVSVVDGIHQGFIGWIVAISTQGVNLFNHATGEAVTVAPHQVAFYEAPKTIYTQTQLDTQQAPKDFHFSRMTAHDVAPPPSIMLPPLRIQNPHQRFIGCQVTIIHGPFKDYRGVVKNTERGDFLNVELQVQSMIQRQFDLKDLAHVDDPYMCPFSMYTSSLAPLPSFEPLEAQQEESHQSSMPLVPSTPIPEGSSAAMGRAWNPSSRTPNPTSSSPCNPWIQSSKLKSETHVSVKTQGTLPVLKDPGWKYGDMEGMPALWKKGEQDGEEPIVWVAVKRQRVPERYLVPLGLTTTGQHVLIINSSDERYCRE